MVGRRAAAGNKKAPVMTGAVGCAGEKGKVLFAGVEHDVVNPGEQLAEGVEKD